MHGIKRINDERQKIATANDYTPIEDLDVEDGDLLWLAIWILLCYLGMEETPEISERDSIPAQWVIRRAEEIRKDREHRDLPAIAGALCAAGMDRKALSTATTERYTQTDQ